MNSRHHKLIKGAFVLTSIYWIYLAFVAQMVIVQDALGYERLGQLIYTQGWIEYFQTGPNREPFYPFLISLSMRIGDLISISYQDVMKVFQIVILFISQWLIYQILKKLKVHPLIIFGVVLFFGFAPDIVNSALSLFSEIATYPFILAIILLHLFWWEGLYLSNNKIFVYASLTAIVFVSLTLVKGVFDLIAPLSLIPYAVLAVKSILQKRKILCGRILISLLVFSVFFYVPVLSFKSTNQKYNNHFVLTNRGSEMFYGNTARHMKELSLERILVGLTCSMSVGDKVICHKLLGIEACSRWDFRISYSLGLEKRQELIDSGMTSQKANGVLNTLAIQKILKNPVHYLIFYGIEGLTMIFWKSAEIGFVAYPNWLSNILENNILKYALSFITALLSLISLVFLMITFQSNKKSIFATAEPADDAKILLYFILLIITIFIACHAFVSVLTRFVLPIVPLYLIMIAHFFNKLIYK